MLSTRVDGTTVAVNLNGIGTMGPTASGSLSSFSSWAGERIWRSAPFATSSPGLKVAYTATLSPRWISP